MMTKLMYGSLTTDGVYVVPTLASRTTRAALRPAAAWNAAADTVGRITKPDLVFRGCLRREPGQGSRM
jgi:hypothetical protein